MAGQSDALLTLFSAEEVEYVAEDELVEIVPNMRMDALNLVCGDFGPFMPQIATPVPLWLAIALKKRGKCAISPPEWMSVGEYYSVLLQSCIVRYSIMVCTGLSSDIYSTSD
uniref:DNA replication complex GINS protein PSF2 N-terminal domain-containing protein n=1 Tax=Kalanchoe fedtschenkoi TaxID=63787 RepID=A0A7N0V6P0_KALFE